MHRMIEADPTLSSAAIAAQLPSPATSRTVRRRLLSDFDLPSRRPARKANLSAKTSKTVWPSVANTKTGEKNTG